MRITGGSHGPVWAPRQSPPPLFIRCQDAVLGPVPSKLHVLAITAKSTGGGSDKQNVNSVRQEKAEAGVPSTERTTYDVSFE